MMVIMSDFQAILSHTSPPRVFCALTDLHEYPTKCVDRKKKVLFTKLQRMSIGPKRLYILTALTFALSGCSSFSLFNTEQQPPKKRRGDTTYSLSDVEMRPMGHNDRIEVTSLPPSTSAMDKNIAISTDALLPDQEIRVETQPVKPKTEAQASLVTHTDPPKPSTPPPPPPVALSRSNLTGKWAIREAGNSGCKVTLSSAPALDLYKASTSGCSGPDIRTVNSWDFRNGEVYLYARGTVIARFKGNGSSLPGSLSKSGAPLVLSR